jgi:hypothetical protein
VCTAVVLFEFVYLIGTMAAQKLRKKYISSEEKLNTLWDVHKHTETHISLVEQHR